MASPSDNDPALQRFRRGAGTRVGPPGPPPVPGGYRPPGVQPPAETQSVAPRSGEPIAPGTVPGWPATPDPARAEPLFGELLGPPPAVEPGEAEPLYDAPSPSWPPVDDDPGRGSGIASIVVGFFVGIVGLFIGVYSVHRSREVGRAGVLGFVGVLVSLLSIFVVGAIGLSWVRYEVDVAQQCSLVGPGHYLTQSGSEVTCR
ncbi:hypothetical protein GCM10025867_10410 [Frondihabitans sucicola]|uniref:DUF4190 domain-containing protein n=1 Tax=Frondihabitans sucicola TaxID=1268041 RepID=A0ABM8GK82_9MICO|nr:hypothetical protein [Frondihabitans sucicola]BDZ48800.1 hypothetical protein GCM10025867_10410 [Frondihabitans sucicola]